MVETLLASLKEISSFYKIAKEASTLFNSTKETLLNPIDKITEFRASETPIQSLTDIIDKNSLESLKVQNEANIEKIKEYRSEIMEKNRENGLSREETAFNELKNDYPESKGFKIERELYLRDKNGDIVKDLKTNEARRIDIVIIKNDNVMKSLEITSERAPKEFQTEKEIRIRAEGGNFVKDRETGKLIAFPENIKTEIRRYP